MHWAAQLVLAVVYLWAATTLTFVVAKLGQQSIWVAIWLGLPVACVWLLPVVAYLDLTKED